MFSYRALRSLASKQRPPQNRYLYGELYVNLGDHQLGVIDQDGVPQDLLAITHFSEDAQYTKGDHVIYQGGIYVANKDITTPKNFDPADWFTSGVDLSVADYDQTKAYKKGATAFFPNFGCFLTAKVDIPANEPYDKAKWEFPCTADPADPGLPDRPGGGGSGYQEGDIVTVTYPLSDQERIDMRLLRCDGAAIDRVAYAALFAKIGTRHGTSTASNFRVPDFRGLFLRDVDDGAGRDPNAANRTAGNTGGNTGDHGGSVQGDDFKQHHHYWRLDNNTYGWGAYDDNDMESGLKATENNPGGNETRPKNIYVYHYIKF